MREIQEKESSCTEMEHKINFLENEELSLKVYVFPYVYDLHL